MSMIMELIQAISTAERQIDYEISTLNVYKGKIDKVIARVQADFGGSGDRFGGDMLQRLQATQKQIDDTLQHLNQAKEKLIRVRTM